MKSRGATKTSKPNFCYIVKQFFDNSDFPPIHFLEARYSPIFFLENKQHFS